MTSVKRCSVMPYVSATAGKWPIETPRVADRRGPRNDDSSFPSVVTRLMTVADDGSALFSDLLSLDPGTVDHFAEPLASTTGHPPIGGSHRETCSAER